MVNAGPPLPPADELESRPVPAPLPAPPKRRMHSLASPGERNEVGLVLVQKLFNERTWQPAAPVRISQVIDAVCERLKRFAERMRTLLRDTLERARAAGELPDDASPEALSTLLVATSNGVALMLRSGAPPERIDEVGAAVLATLLP